MRGRVRAALLFGVAPVAVVGVVVGTYLVGMSGRTHASAQAGFHAQAPASSAGQVVQNALTPSSVSTPVSSPSKKAKASPAASISFPALPKSTLVAVPVTGSTAPGVAASRAPAAAKPRPVHKQVKASASPSPSPAPAPTPTRTPVPIPADLGAPDYAAYCAHLGQGNAVTVNSTAYGWRCTGEPGVMIPGQAACAYTFRDDDALIINVTRNYFVTTGTECWSTNGEAAQVTTANWDAYCEKAFGTTALLTGSTVFNWVCKPNHGINVQTLCDEVTGLPSTEVFALFAVESDPYSWECWG
jgi:hypothetical protein